MLSRWGIGLAPDRGRVAAVARLAPGTSPDLVREALSRGGTATGRGVSAHLVADALREDLRGPLWILLAAAALVLLIASANVGSLAIARDLERRTELAVHRALGAGRGRIAAQVAAEGLLLSSAAAALAMALAPPLRGALLRLAPGFIPAYVPAGVPGADPDARPVRVHHRAVSAGYREIMEIELLQGRDLLETDDAGAPRVVVLNELAAGALWPDDPTPLGRLVRLDPGGGEAEFRVVGIVADARVLGGTSTSRPEVWTAFRQTPARRFHLLLSQREAAVPAFRVRRLRRELGIRQAFGASPRALGFAVIGRSLGTALGGAAVGAGATWLAGGWIGSRLYLHGVEPRDAGPYAIALAVVTVIALLGASAPALRAARADPVAFLRDVDA